MNGWTADAQCLQLRISQPVMALVLNHVVNHELAWTITNQPTKQQFSHVLSYRSTSHWSLHEFDSLTNSLKPWACGEGSWQITFAVYKQLDLPWTAMNCGYSEHENWPPRTFNHCYFFGSPFQQLWNDPLSQMLLATLTRWLVSRLARTTQWWTSPRALCSCAWAIGGWG